MQSVSDRQEACTVLDTHSSRSSQPKNLALGKLPIRSGPISSANVLIALINEVEFQGFIGSIVPNSVTDLVSNSALVPNANDENLVSDNLQPCFAVKLLGR
jgi:hypothetical protein